MTLLGLSPVKKFAKNGYVTLGVDALLANWFALCLRKPSLSLGPAERTWVNPELPANLLDAKRLRGHVGTS